MTGSARFITICIVLLVLVFVPGCTEKTPSLPAQTPAPTGSPVQTTAGTPTSAAQPTVQPTPTLQPVSVKIKNFAFVPASITIPRGTTVTWTQEDSVPHTVTGTGFDSGSLSQGETFSYTFNERGTFNYACSIHSGMSGTITVT